jgi:hypothetical protein
MAMQQLTTADAYASVTLLEFSPQLDGQLDKTEWYAMITSCAPAVHQAVKLSTEWTW